MGPIYPIYKPGSSTPVRTANGSSKARATGFAELLEQELRRCQIAGLEFSKHAIKRSLQRGIMFDEHDLSKISSAVDKMQQKGSREALLLYKNVGLLVNVRDRKVITCVNKERLKEDVFTNIDGVMILE